MTTAAMMPAEPRRLHRASGGRTLAGVAGGLAEHLGLSPVVLRLAFTVLAMAGGAGLVMYAAFWVFVPLRDGAADERRDGAGQLVAFSALAAGGLLAMNGLGLGSTPALLVPLGLAVSGVALVWRQADEAQRARWRASAGGGRRLTRVAGGATLLLLGLAGFLALRGQLGAARQGLLSTFVVVAGLAVLTWPFWLRLSRDLQAERRERIRSQERAELAAQVHDSVLQTLALIRKAADDPREVTRLARGQERELRGWLYQPTRNGDLQLAVALERVAAEVEELHRVAVEVVVVGDCAVDAHVAALVAAGREAMVNAARHSGASVVQVYAEVEAGRLVAFVRDRGTGFEVSAVPADRLGLSRSVVARMARNGGSADVRSTPGEGTEVRLELPRG